VLIDIKLLNNLSEWHLKRQEIVLDLEDLEEQNEEKAYLVCEVTDFGRELTKKK
jgi:hypothetical protein